MNVLRIHISRAMVATQDVAPNPGFKISLARNSVQGLGFIFLTQPSFGVNLEVVSSYSQHVSNC